jgi:DNA replication protein DnaC
LELAERRQRRVQRRRKASGLPANKTLTTWQAAHLPTPVRRQLSTLCEGQCVEQAQHVLAFGLPGRGKRHLLCAVGHALVERGYRVLFTPAYQLVQRWLAAKPALRLEQELHQLDGFAAIMLDDSGYVQQSRAELEVLFTFLAERYERQRVLISSHLVFSQGDRSFQDAKTAECPILRSSGFCRYPH